MAANHNSDKRETVLSVNSGLSIGVIITLLTCSFWLATRLTQIDSGGRERSQAIEAKLAQLQRDMMMLNERINSRMSDRWTATMMGVYNREIQSANPNIKTPVVQEIQQRHPPENMPAYNP